MTSHDDIRQERRAIETERIERQKALNADLEPRVKAMRAACEAIGHVRQGHGFNLLRNLEYDVCGVCGAAFNERREEDS